MIFLDFEASALRGGFPIEIGWAEVLPDRTIVTESHLILCERWMGRLDRWDPAAEALHRISRQRLVEHGRSPEEVANRVNEVLAGATIYIDSPFDRDWATILFAEAGIGQRFSFGDVDAAFQGEEIDTMAYRYARGMVDRAQPMTHRAAEDAKHWATLYRMSLKEGAAPRNLRHDGMADKAPAQKARFGF